jgi:dTDP-4-amino-4,6-dideoxygalactose transaminase
VIGFLSTYKGKPLGTIGHFGCFSFHYTKNVICGEGGALAVNRSMERVRQAMIMWEKGTNR